MSSGRRAAGGVEAGLNTNMTTATGANGPGSVLPAAPPAAAPPTTRKPQEGVTREAEPEPGGDTQRERHRHHREEGGDRLGKVVPANARHVADHEGADRHQRGRGGRAEGRSR